MNCWFATCSDVVRTHFPITYCSLIVCLPLHRLVVHTALHAHSPGVNLPRHPSWLSLSVLHVSLDGATLTRPKLAKHPLFWSSPNARPYQCSRSGSPPQTSGFKNDNSWQVGFDLQFIKYLLCVYPCNTVIICTNFWYPMNSCQICCRRGNFIFICLKWRKLISD